MSYKLDQQTSKTSRVRSLFVVALVLGCTLGVVPHAAAQTVTPPTTPDTITPPEGNTAFLVGHAFGTQGYVCLPAGAGGTSWTVNNARPEATLFTNSFGLPFQIITHFLSIDANPNKFAPDPLPPGGNVTWQSSLDTSRVWAVVADNGNAKIPAGSDPNSCANFGAIPCLLLVNREPKGANRRSTSGRCHLHPTPQHQGRSGPPDSLHGGSDSARALHCRLLLLPHGRLGASLSLEKGPAMHAEWHQSWHTSRAWRVDDTKRSPKSCTACSGAIENGMFRPYEEGGGLLNL